MTSTASLETQKRIRDALATIAAETGEPLPAVIAEALIASVTVLTATSSPRRVNALYLAALKLGKWTKAELQRDMTVLPA